MIDAGGGGTTATGGGGATLAGGGGTDAGPTYATGVIVIGDSRGICDDGGICDGGVIETGAFDEIGDTLAGGREIGVTLAGGGGALFGVRSNCGTRGGANAFVAGFVFAFAFALAGKRETTSLFGAGGTLVVVAAAIGGAALGLRSGGGIDGFFGI